MPRVYLNPRFVGVEGVRLGSYLGAGGVDPVKAADGGGCGSGVVGGGVSDDLARTGVSGTISPASIVDVDGLPYSALCPRSPPSLV